MAGRGQQAEKAKGYLMLEQSVEEIAEAMAFDPHTWAELYLEQQKQLSEMAEVVERARGVLLGAVDAGAEH